MLFLNSCTSLQPLDIQIAKTEPFPLPDNIQSIAILNSAIKPGFTNLTNDSLERLLHSKNLLIHSVLSDSMAVDTTIKTVARALYESGRYDVVIPLQKNILHNDELFLDYPLPISFIEEICNDFNTDAVLVLESFIETQMATSLNSFLPDNEGGKISVAYKSFWRIYQSCDSCGIRLYDISDIIFWRKGSPAVKDVNDKLPSLKESLIDGGVACGFKLAGYISPEWVNYYREYFVTRNKQIDAAIPLIKNNKWEEAASIWSKFAAISSKSIRSKVEFNLALAAEMNGDLGIALQWCRKSLKTTYSFNKKDYLSVLERRQKEQEKKSGNTIIY